MKNIEYQLDVRKNFKYQRVSTSKQKHDRQDDVKFYDTETGKEVVFDEVFKDTISGTKQSRQELDRMLDKLRPGDVIYTESLSRIGRDTKDLLSKIELIESKGARLVSKKESIDSGSPQGRLLTQIFCILSEFEVSCLKERTKMGLESARARGKLGGRPKAKDADVKLAVDLYDTGKYSVREICKKAKITHATLYKYLKIRNDEIANLDDKLS